VLIAADLCGISEIYKVGGAQAIAAMALGTASIRSVSKIVGPGNRYVTEAKMQLYGDVDIDMPAGPSEVLVCADGDARPEWIAADMLSQLEHSEDAQAILVTQSEALARSVLSEISRQVPRLSRKKIIQQSLKNSYVLISDTEEDMVTLINGYAPEHLELIGKGAERLSPKIKNAGSVFLGPYSSEPLGDYATGSNHTLPTAGFAKMFSGLSTESFLKKVQFQRVSRQGLLKLSKTAQTLALREGLDAHAVALRLRITKPQ
jgi:histidinol dehydrogenase